MGAGTGPAFSLSGLDSAAHLPSVETTLALSDIYALIELESDGAGV